MPVFEWICLGMKKAEVGYEARRVFLIGILCCDSRHAAPTANAANRFLQTCERPVPSADAMEK